MLSNICATCRWKGSLSPKVACLICAVHPDRGGIHYQEEVGDDTQTHHAADGPVSASPVTASLRLGISGASFVISKHKLYHICDWKYPDNTAELLTILNVCMIPYLENGVGICYICSVLL